MPTLRPTLLPARPLALCLPLALLPLALTACPSTTSTELPPEPSYADQSLRYDHYDTDGAYSTFGVPWSDGVLTYRFDNGTPDVPGSSEEAAFLQAFDLWEAACSELSFVPTGGSADIHISFESGSHGDGNAFDGHGGVLAHAFAPSQPLSGDAHFDEAEHWSIDQPTPTDRVDLVTVAAHEIGHSLGLGHSADPDALMYESYFGAHRWLHDDDVDGIQDLYGCGGSIEVLAPGNGDVLYSGSESQVAWSSVGIVQNVKIEVYRGSAMHLQIAANQANDGAYPFDPVASLFPPGADYSVCIATVDQTVFDCGDTFEIRAPLPPGDDDDSSPEDETPVTELQVLSPANGDILVSGTEYAVTWSSVGIDQNVKIEVYDGSTMHLQIAANEPDDGSYPFDPIAQLFPPGDDYSICIVTVDQTVFDCGSSFEIQHEVLDEDPVDEDPVDEDPVEDDPVDEDPIDEDPIDEDPVDEDPLDCSASPNLVEGWTAYRQFDDSGESTSVYTLGTEITPVENVDQVLLQLPFALPQTALRVCVDYEITGSTWGNADTKIIQNAPPWTARWVVNRGVSPGAHLECFDVPAATGAPISPTQIAALRHWIAVDGYVVHDIAICEI